MKKKGLLCESRLTVKSIILGSERFCCGELTGAGSGLLQH